MKNKLKAFTILEMLMSISIMAIIVSLLYFIYTSFSKQVFLYKNETSSIEEVYGFYTQLRKDAYLCSEIIKQNNRLEFGFYDGSKVFYNMSKNSLQRAQASQKTSIKTLDFEFIFQTPKLKNKQLVRNFEFETLLLGRKTTFSVSKNYAADVLFEAYGN